MPVEARTTSDPNSPVEFSYERVHLHPPAVLLRLLTHEFGHKVNFDGPPLDDTSKILSFDSGRNLLDAVGAAVASLAERRGIIDSSFLLQDFFDCTSEAYGRQQYIGGNSPRRFPEQKNLNQYEVTIGKNVRDMRFGILEDASRVEFRAEIHEEAGCSPKAAMYERWTSVELIRVHKSLPGTQADPDELLAAKTIQGFNPLCTESGNLGFEISYGDSMRVRCEYSGSVAFSGFQKNLVHQKIQNKQTISRRRNQP
jgi:hypothetical protein